MNYDTNRQYNKNLFKMGRFFLFKKAKIFIYFNIHIISSVKLYKTLGTLVTCNKGNQGTWVGRNFPLYFPFVLSEF